MPSINSVRVVNAATFRASCQTQTRRSIIRFTERSQQKTTQSIHHFPIQPVESKANTFDCDSDSFVNFFLPRSNAIRSVLQHNPEYCPPPILVSFWIPSVRPNATERVFRPTGKVSSKTRKERKKSSTKEFDVVVGNCFRVVDVLFVWCLTVCARGKT